MGRYLKIGGIIILILCALWITYKQSLLNQYEPWNTRFEINKTTIATDKSLANTTYNDINIYIPDKLNGTENNSNIIITKTNTTLGQLADLTDNVDATLQEYKIEDDLDMLLYYKDHKDDSRDIFTRKRDLEMQFLSGAFVSLLPYTEGYETINYFESDLRGFYFTGVNFIYMTLINNQEYYFVQINKNEFEQDEIEKIMTSIYFTESSIDNPDDQNEIASKYTNRELEMIEEFYDAEILSAYKSIIELPLSYDPKDARQDGVYVDSHTGVYNEQKLENFLDKYENGDQAFIRVVTYTTEGDPIIRDIKCDKNRVQILTDTTRDEYGGYDTQNVTLKEYDQVSRATLLQKIRP